MPTLDLPNGLRVEVTAKAEAMHLYREIFLERQYACWSPTSARPTVIDVGANIGMFSLFALAQWTPARLLAIEAIPDVAELLRANLAGREEAVVVNAGVGSQDTVARFGFYPRCSIMSGRHTDVGHDRAAVERSASLRAAGLPEAVRTRVAGSIAAVTTDQFAEVREVDVRVHRLDALLADHGIEHVDLLKIDVEGDELDVLDGLGDHSARVDTIVAEIDTSRVVWADVMSWFDGHGFAVSELPRGPGDLDTMRMVTASAG